MAIERGDPVLTLETWRHFAATHPEKRADIEQFEQEMVKTHPDDPAAVERLLQFFQNIFTPAGLACDSTLELRVLITQFTAQAARNVL